MKKTYSLLVIVLVLAYLFTAPYIATYRLYKAAKSGDGETVSELVDFISLRQSMKEQLTVLMAEEMGNDEKLKGNPFSMLGMVLADSLVSKMIDMFVTPAGVTKIIKKTSEASHNGNDKINTTAPIKLSDVRTRWVTISKFSAIVEKNNVETEFVMRRKGIEWKLSEIVIPLDEINSIAKDDYSN